MITTTIISTLFCLNVNLNSELQQFESNDKTRFELGQPNIVKTERIEKDRKFLFWKLPHKKVIIIDQYTDSNDKVIFRTKSKSICSLDACSDIKFRRIKIVNDEVWIFKYNRNPENAVIKRYDLMGKYLGQKDWKDESFDEY